MFENHERQPISRQQYKQRSIELRQALLDAQQRLWREKRRVIILFHGVDGAGKSECANLLNEWMDPRWIVTQAYDVPTQEEAERPRFWRYWRDLPARGSIAILLRAWYSEPLLERVYGRTDVDEMSRQLDQICHFERMLTDDGALVVKFWMHLDKKGQKRRFEALESDPDQAWRVTKRDWEHWKQYDEFIAAAQRLIQATGTEQAPWAVIEGSDPRWYRLRMGELLLTALNYHLAPEKPLTGARLSASEGWLAGGPEILGKLDMTKSIGKEDYKQTLEHEQARLSRLERDARLKGVSTMFAFEGWDAAGKGGAIRRVTAGLDARSFRVIRVAAPTEEERGHHYLWRFWRHLPRAGRVTIFDRSWYGRVMVERVEGYASPWQWRRAYSEINEFEKELVEAGIVLRKFWINITKDEQKRRFDERAKTAHKAWKLTDEDWRNREKWDEYEQAVNDMLRLTNSEHAPWVVVEGNNKRYARIKVIRAVCDAMQDGLDDMDRK